MLKSGQYRNHLGIASQVYTFISADVLTKVRLSLQRLFGHQKATFLVDEVLALPLKTSRIKVYEPIHVVNGRTQLLFVADIEHGIPDCQLLKYQPSMTSRVIFHHLIPLIVIAYQNISQDVTNG